MSIVSEVLAQLDNIGSVEFRDVSLKDPKVVTPIDILIAQITDRLELIDLDDVKDNDDLETLLLPILDDLNVERQCFNIASAFTKQLCKARDAYRNDVHPKVFELTNVVENKIQENLTRRGYAELSKYEGYEHVFVVHEWHQSCTVSDILLENAKALTKDYVKRYSIGAVEFIMDTGYTKPQNYKAVGYSDETLSDMIMDIADKDSIVELFVESPIAGGSMTEQIVEAIDILTKRPALQQLINDVKLSCGASVAFSTFINTVNRVERLKAILSELDLDKLGATDAVSNNFSMLKDILDINVAFCFASKRKSLESVLVLDEDTLNEDCYKEDAEYTPQDIFKYNVINDVPASGRTEQAVAAGYKSAVLKFDSRSETDSMQARGVYLTATADAMVSIFGPALTESGMDLATRGVTEKAIHRKVTRTKFDSLAVDVLVNDVYLEYFAGSNMVKFCNQLAVEYERLPANRLNKEGKAAVEAAAYNTLISDLITPN